MRPGQGPAAGPPVSRQTSWGKKLDFRRALAVPELADVEISFALIDADGGRPAEEDVARRLHQTLPSTTRSPWFPNSLAPT